MIIISTSTGGHLLNEEHTVEVAHDIETASVRYSTPQGQSFSIPNVEHIVYATDAQPNMWDEDGKSYKSQKNELEIEKLSYKMADLYAWHFRSIATQALDFIELHLTTDKAKTTYEELMTAIAKQRKTLDKNVARIKSEIEKLK